MCLFKLLKLNPSAIDTFAMVFAQPLAIRKLTNGGRFVNIIAISLIVNYCTRWRRNFKGLSEDGEWVDFF